MRVKRMNLFDGTSDQFTTPGSAMPFDSIERMSQPRNDEDDEEDLD